MTNYNRQDQLAEQIQALLADKGLDRFKPVALSFYVELYNEKQANKFAKELTFEGFETDIDAFQQLSGIWRCWSSVKLIPNDDNLKWLQTILTDKCTRFDGQIVSWETNPYASGQELGQLMAKLEHQYQEAI